MNVAFWDNTLSERGTTTSLFDYAYYNQTILKNKSYIFYTNGQNNNGNVINKFKKHFIVTKVNNFEEVDTYLLKYQITHIYIIKYGLIDDRISKVAKNCIHSVFDCRQPHGDIYASISPWVDYYTEIIPVVPHMINLPQCSENLRDKLNIPKNAVVFGGYGGKMQFNIPFVHNTVLKVAETHPNIYFLFANFKPINGSQIHSNIIYVPTIIDLEEKVKFINTCDAMLWGRDDGETFGISIGEFSTHNKPVIMTDIGKNAHVHLLGDKGIKYTNTENLTEILINFNPEVESKKDWNAYRDYTPTKVMSQFQSVFLSYKSHFTFIPNKTQMNNDLKRDTEFRNDNSLSQEMKLEKYMQTAFFNKACAGFSTMGYYKSSIDELTTSKYFQNGDGLYVKKIYNDGIYICGCVKNCAQYLQGVFNNIQFINAFFQKCHIVIAYDNSYDGSLTILKKISQEMNLPITILEGKNTSEHKVVNICNARNSILDYIRKQQQDPKQSNFKYMLMMDMDNVSASPINMQVFHNTMKREKEWDAITFNQQDYYDIWALSVDDYVCSCWHFESKPYLGAKTENVRKIKQYITEKIKNVKKDELIECKSAFNGVGIYKTDKFIHSHYEYDIKKTLRYITADEIKRNEEKMGYRFNINSWSGQYDCEHRYFHLKAQRINKEHLKICINPQFLFKNYIHDDPFPLSLKTKPHNTINLIRSKICQHDNWTKIENYLEDKIKSPIPITFISFAENYFFNNNQPIHTPWVGIMHDPPNVKQFYPNSHPLISNKTFISSYPHCCGLFCMSQSLKKCFAENMKPPLFLSILHHPLSNKKLKEWNMDKFQKNKGVWQIGNWLRKPYFIFKLNTTLNKHIIPFKPQLKNELNLFCSQDNINLTDEEINQVKGRVLTNDEYDNIFSENIVALYLYASTCNNVILECITANCPLLINRLPEIEDYLGVEYPFFYESMEEAELKIENMELINKTHQYLKQMDKTKFKMETLLLNINNSLKIFNSNKDIYHHKLKTITPPSQLITWAKNPKKLTCCIVEPRTMPELNGVLNNMAKIYGNTDEVGLRIYHGTENINFIKNIAEKWKNTELINLNVDNLKISEYSNLLTKKSFYKSFSSSHVLIFQTDSYIFKQIPEYYFNFDYVGAPWRGLNGKGNGCGNGGISLRKIETMIKTTTEEGTTIPEDLYFTKQDIRVCDNKKLHEQFSVENIFVDEPVCCHQPYHCMEKNKRTLDFLNKIV